MGSSLKQLLTFGKGPSGYSWGSCTLRPLCTLRQSCDRKSTRHLRNCGKITLSVVATTIVFSANSSTVKNIHKTRDYPRGRKTRICALPPQQGGPQPVFNPPGGASGNRQQAASPRDQANIDLLVSLGQQFARESLPWIQVRALSVIKRFKMMMSRTN